MMTGVFILNDLIRQGRIRRGMVVSGEYISELGRNAARDIRTIWSDQLASLTLGDAGAAAIVERAPDGARRHRGGRLHDACPSTAGCAWRSRRRTAPGSPMHTEARAIHKVAIEDAAPLLREVLDQAGLEFDEIDYLFRIRRPSRAIKQGDEGVRGALGAAPKHVVVTVDEFGNTASTTHFVALWKYLRRAASPRTTGSCSCRSLPVSRSESSSSRSISWWDAMGTIIEASATAAAHRGTFSPGALELADAAARTCLERADRTAEELDLLINAGVYHDKRISEPAFASLIQEDIGANPDRPSAAGHGTFSFDVANGAAAC